MFPEGADELEITYYLNGDKGNPKTLTASPNAPPVIPEADLASITGFEFTFSSKKLHRHARWHRSKRPPAGSIELQTKLRDGATPGK